MNVKRKSVLIRNEKVDKPLVRQLLAGYLLPLVERAVVKDVWHGLHGEAAPTGGGFQGEESGSERPDRGMSGDATHQAGRQLVTVTHPTHPGPTVDMGRDEKVLTLIEG
jgi:hypothetical protein